VGGLFLSILRAAAIGATLVAIPLASVPDARAQGTDASVKPADPKKATAAKTQPAKPPSVKPQATKPQQATKAQPPRSAQQQAPKQTAKPSGKRVVPAAAATGAGVTAAGALAATRGDWARAREMAQRGQEPLLAKVTLWLDLKQARNGGSFRDIAAFIEANPTWPNRTTLLLRAEDSINGALGDGETIAWFAKYPPQTTNGRLRLIQALDRSGDGARAAQLARATWIAGNFSAATERDFQRRWSGELTPADHIARLDRLLWDGQAHQARLMAPLVSHDHRALAEARIKFRAGEGGVDAALAKVPAALRGDPGLSYERVRWYRTKGRDSDAREILESPPAELIRPDLWWREREIQVRRALREGNVSQSYKLAARHGQAAGSAFADGEFLAGWIALRFLDDSAQAYEHFKRLHENVGSAISQARAAYWAGRAAEVIGRPDEARAWYGRGQHWTTTFYGQLAAAKLGGEARLPADPLPSAQEIGAFEANELVRVVKTLGRHKLLDQIQPFVYALSDHATSHGERVLIAALARDQGRGDVAVAVSRRMAQRDGIQLIDGGYPLLPVSIAAAPERALVHALVRQESNFDQRAISRAGALGLMQLMPATARQVARELKVDYAQPRLLADPIYNVQMGRHYLGVVLNDFDGAYAIALGAYNAGPGRVRAWLREFGDPRRGDVDMLDWIEQVPFAETRNYIQRVLEGVHVYRARLNAPLTLAGARPSDTWCLFGCGMAMVEGPKPVAGAHIKDLPPCLPGQVEDCRAEEQVFQPNGLNLDLDTPAPPARSGDGRADARTEARRVPVPDNVDNRP
jgi:soluble lytic murein transglycosylase